MLGFNIQVLLKINKLNKKGMAPIVLNCYISKKVKFEIAIGLSIPPAAWNKDRQNIKENFIDLAANNIIIEHMRSRLSDVVRTLTLNNKPLTKESILNQYKNYDNRIDFIQYFEKKLEFRYNRGELSANTHKTHLSTLKKCKLFSREWLFADINSKLIEDFQVWMYKYLKKNSVNTGRDLKNGGQNTVMAALKIIRTYMILAQNDEIKFTKPKFKLRWAPTSRTSITQKELEVLIDAYNNRFLDSQQKHEALELFLFACSTGLRISDMKKVSSEHIIDDCIVMVAKKTEKHHITVSIPINPFIAKMIEGKKGLFFPKITEQEMNRQLKNVAFNCGIDVNLSMNVGRHTFATLWLQSGGNLKALQDILGHRNLATTMNYLHRDSSFNKKEMLTKFGNIFNR